MARTTWREERQSVCCPCARVSQSNHGPELNSAAILLRSKPTLPPFAPLEFRISRKALNRTTPRRAFLHRQWIRNYPGIEITAFFGWPHSNVVQWPPPAISHLTAS